MKEQLYLNKEIIMTKSDDMMVSVEGKKNWLPRIGGDISISYESDFQKAFLDDIYWDGHHH